MRYASHYTQWARVLKVLVLVHCCACSAFESGVHSSRARRSLDEGDAKTSFDEATIALELLHSNVDAYIVRGEAGVRLGKYDEAIADYTRALEIRPGDVEATRGPEPVNENEIVIFGI